MVGERNSKKDENDGIDDDDALGEGPLYGSFLCSQMDTLYFFSKATRYRLVDFIGARSEKNMYLAFVRETSETEQKKLEWSLAS